MKNIFKSFYQNPSVWFTTSYDQNKLNQNMYSILNSHKIFKSNEQSCMVHLRVDTDFLCI